MWINVAFLAVAILWSAPSILASEGDRPSFRFGEHTHV
jgi:hypothetical protein